MHPLYLCNVNVAKMPVSSHHLTFSALLQDGGWGRSHLHGQAVRSSEWMTVSDDERARLFILQHCDSCSTPGDKSRFMTLEEPAKRKMCEKHLSENDAHLAL